MSEHEGFGVPLVESLFYRIPIVAFAAAAVPSTLGGAGVLITEKRPREIAALIHRIVTDQALRDRIVAAQDRRLNYFQQFPYHERWEKALKRLMG